MPEQKKRGTRKSEAKRIEGHVALITELIVRGYTVQAVLKLQRDNARAKAKGAKQYRPEWEFGGVTEPTLRGYYKKALAEVHNLEKASLEQDLAITLHQYNDLYRRCLTDGRYSVAARVLHDKARLLGLDAFFVQTPEEPAAQEGEREEVTEVKLPDGTTIAL